jgi:putative transposase
MGIARSTYYDRPMKAADNTAIVEAMFAICDAFEFYGYRRVGAALRQQGFVVNHKKIRRLMREHDLQPRVRRRFVATTWLAYSPSWGGMRRVRSVHREKPSAIARA